MVGSMIMCGPSAIPVGWSRSTRVNDGGAVDRVAPQAWAKGDPRTLLAIRDSSGQTASTFRW